MTIDFSFFTSAMLFIATIVGAAYGLFAMPPSFRDILKKNGLFIIIGLYLIGISYVIGGNTSAAMDNNYFNAALIAGPIILAFIVLLRSNNTDFTQAFKMNTYTVIPLVIFGLFFAALLYADGVDPAAIKFFGNIVLASIFIVGAVIFFQVFKNIAYSLEGLPGIIARILLLIPCFISDFFTMVFGQLKTSPFVVYALLALELVLILAYLFLPKLFKKIDEGNGKQALLSKPVVLKSETRIANSFGLTKPATGNMALSMWIYIVPMSASNAPYNEEAVVFEFGNQHPRITYRESILKVYYAPELSYETRIPTQTWVHVVFNYKDNNTDLFINGDLVKTANYPLLMTNPEDMFVIGQEKGIHGGLSALVYFNKALTDLEIKRLYDAGKNKDPPMA